MGGAIPGRIQSNEFRYLDDQDVEFLIETTLELFPDRPSDLTLPKGGKELLESALASPRWDYRRTLEDKAAALHFSLIKNHPFVDGNKRFAMAATSAFLFFNQALLIAPDDILEDISLRVADNSLSREELTAYYRISTVRTYWSDSEVDAWLDQHFSVKEDEIRSLYVSETFEHQLYARVAPVITAEVEGRHAGSRSSRGIWARIASRLWPLRLKRLPLKIRVHFFGD